MNDGAVLAAFAALNAGVPPAMLPIAVAVAGAESGWSPNPPGPNDQDNPYKGCRSYGMWQINVCPGREKPGPPFYGDNPSVLLGTEANAKAMFDRSGHGSNFSAWTTYTSGKYKNFLNTAQEASDYALANQGKAGVDPMTGDLGAAVGGGGPLGVIAAGPGSDYVPGISTVAGFLGALTSHATFVRIIEIGFGVAGLAVAFVLLHRDLIGPAVKKGAELAAL